MHILGKSPSPLDTSMDVESPSLKPVERGAREVGTI